MKKTEVITKVLGVKGVKIDRSGVVNFDKRVAAARSTFINQLYQLLSEIVGINVSTLDQARQHIVMLLRANAPLIARYDALPMNDGQRQRLENVLNACLLYRLLHNVFYPTDVSWERVMEVASCLSFKQNQEVIYHLQEHSDIHRPAAEELAVV